MADLTDDEALTAAEQAVWTYRGLEKLHAVIQYTRNARKDIPVLQQQVADLTSQVAQASAEVQAWHAKLERTVAETKPAIEELVERRATLTTEVAQLQRALDAATDSAEALSERVKADQARADRLAEQVAEREQAKAALDADLAAREQKLADLKALAARLSA